MYIWDDGDAAECPRGATAELPVWATRVYVLGRTVVPVLESRPSALHLILGTHPAFPRDDSLKPKRATRCSPPPPTDLRPSRSYRLQPNPPPLLHILGLDTCARSGSTRSVSVPNLRDAAGAHHPPARSASLLLIDTVASVPVARLRPSAGRLGMATPDPHVKYGAGARATALVPDDFAVRAAPVKKRHSFFGRPESMSSLHSPSSSRLAPSPSVQGVLYHDLPDRPSLDLGRRRQQSDPPPEARRRSFFNGRWRLHKPARPDPPCNDEPAPVAEPTNTADSPPDTMARPRAVFTNEDEYYRHHTKQTISPPFNFKHVAHTRKKHLPALDSVDEKDLPKEFWAASAYQVPRRQVNGIPVDDLTPKLEALGVPRGAPSSRPTTPMRSDSPVSPTVEPARPPSRSRNHEIGAFLGLREKRPMSPAGQSQRDEIKALLGFNPPSDPSNRHKPLPPFRPKREDSNTTIQSLQSIRSQLLPASPLAPAHPPERPRRDEDDVQRLKNLGFGQLLYQPRSNSPHDTPRSSGHAPSLRDTQVEETKPPPTSDSESAAVGEAPIYPGIGLALGAVADEAAKLPSSRSQELTYRAKQPLPAVPGRPASSATTESRSPLQPVTEVDELPSPPPSSALPSPPPSAALHSPPTSSVDPGFSPTSPPSQLARNAKTALSSTPELTANGMPDAQTWEDEIDFVYKQEAESTCNFDWDSVSNEAQRSPQSDLGPRLSLGFPAVPSGRLSARLPQQKLSEGSLRSLHNKSASQGNMSSVGHRGFLHARKQFSPFEETIGENEPVNARVSPEVRVVDMSDRKPDLPPLAMHGYDSGTAGYLSDPESANSVRSQHRKSSSYSSYESIARRSVGNKEQPGRSSNASLSSVPELTHNTARRSKPPGPAFAPPNHLQPLPHSPLVEIPIVSTGGPAQHPDAASAAHYRSMRRPERVEENEILHTPGTAVKESRLDGRRYSRMMHLPSLVSHSEENYSGWI